MSSGSASVAVPGRTHTRVWWTIAVGLWLVALALVVGLILQLPLSADSAGYRDFPAYYKPALLLRQGKNPYVEVPTPGDTPSWFLCFEPLTHLPIHAAYWTWFVLNGLFLAASLRILARGAALEAPQALSTGALMVMYPPVVMNFWYAQSEVCLLFVLVLVMHEVRRGRQVTAGLLLAGAGLLRAYPLGLLGYLVARRKWRAAAFTISGCLVGLAATWAIAGTDVITSFVNNAGILRGAGLFGEVLPLNQLKGIVRHPANLNFGWFVKFVMEHAFGLEQTSPLAGSIAALAELALAALAFVQTARFAADDDRDGRAFSLWVITISLLSPIMWGPFMACFVIVFIAIAGAASRHQVSQRAIWAATSSYLLLAAFGNMQGYPFNWSDRIERTLAATHPHLFHVLGETPTASVLLLLLAAYWFTCDGARAAGVGWSSSAELGSRAAPS